MPNLVGMWAPEMSKESIFKTLCKQLHRVRIPNIAYDEYVDAHPGFGMALQDHGILENGAQPAKTEDGRVSLLLDGELYNGDELKRRFRKELPQCDISLPELCLRLITNYGENIVELFNGLFCLVLYDRGARRVTLISDRFGFRPLFYVRRQQAVIFGSELKAVCAVDPGSRRVDEIGTLELFCYGSHFMDRTWIDGYLRLPPATIMTVDEAGVRTHVYWRYKYDEGAPKLDQTTYFTVYSTLLDRAVERCMKGSHRIGLFLSGGYDSRSVAASIRKHYLPLPAFTFGHPGSRDVRYAAMLAERIGLKHHALTEKSPYLYQNCRAVVWRTEGMCSFANCTSIRYHPFLKEHVDIILLGFLGEFGGSHVWPQLLAARSRQAAIKAIFGRMAVGRLTTVRRIFNSSFLERAFDALRSRFQQSFESIDNDHPLNIADCWNLVHLQPRSTYQSPSVDRHLFEARAPHMDYDLVSFLLTIPPYSRLEQRIYKKMIAYSFPVIRDVPCANSGLPIDPKFVREYATMATRYLGKKVTEPFKRLFDLRQPLGREFRDMGKDFRAEPEVAKCILRPLIEGEVLVSTIFDHSGIEAIITDHYNGKGNHEAMLSLLVSWGLAAKYFLHDNLSDAPEDMFIPSSARSTAHDLDALLTLRRTSHIV